MGVKYKDMLKYGRQHLLLGTLRVSDKTERASVKIDEVDGGTLVWFANTPTWMTKTFPTQSLRHNTDKLRSDGT